MTKSPIILTDDNTLPTKMLNTKDATIFGGEKSINISELMKKRSSGVDRYIISLEIAKDGFKDSKTVIVASGEDYPDALSAISIAKDNKASILLVKNNTVSEDILKYIGQNIEKIIVVGGEKTIGKVYMTRLIHL